ncbi:MAG: carboxypeptidase-like regulatory domain-containing protein [Acidobacteriota bacterium]|nr:carboxypeptidase-like regulatory domain-containing protein [Acidobacteriota bacterium]
MADKSVYSSFSIAPTAKASHVYYNFTGGNLTLNITPATTDMITRNDDWSGVFAIEGFCGTSLTNTHGVDPQTVLGTGQTNDALPTSKCVNANKQNPSAFNTGGATEFDAGDHLGIGFQGNVQANPYLVFYLNTTGQTKVFMSYEVSDIDKGTNNSVSQVALQYRVGETGSFINIPEGFVADATLGPNDATLKTTRGVYLPAGALNQPKVQVRLISTNAAAPDGTSTPDEWVGINNIVVTNQTTTASAVSVTGRARTSFGRPISRALVTIMDSMGNTRSTVTNPFGYYRFDDVQVGEGYVFTIYSKRYVFTEPTQFRLINSEDQPVDFLAEF